MLISTLVITGGTFAVGAGMFQKRRQPSKSTYWTDYHKKVTKKSQKKKKKQKKRFSLYEAIEEFNETLRLDQMVLTSRQIEGPFFQRDLPLWQETEKQEPKAKKSQQERHSTQKDGELLLRHLSKYWTPYWKAGLLGGLCVVSFGVYEMTFAYALKVIVGKVTSGQNLAAIPSIVGKLLIAFPPVALTAIAGERIAVRVGSRAVRDLYYDMFEYLQKLSVSFYKHTKLGDILARFSSDMFYVRVGLAEFIPAMAEILIIAINVAFLTWLSWEMAFLNLLSLPILIYVLQEFSPYYSAANFGLKKEEASLAHVVQEGVRAQPMIKSFGIQQFIQDSFSIELDRLDDSTADALFSRAVLERVIVNALFLCQLLSISTGLLLLSHGYLSVATLVSFLLVQNIFTVNMRKLFRYRLSLLISAAVGLRRVNQLFQNKIEIVDAPDAIELRPFHRAIRFEDVSFGYTKESYQLNQVDFTIEAGQFVAFVGPSGAGKSTIFNLLLRFYEIDSGRVTVDGCDVRDVTQASLRQQMGIVLQDTFIFNISILNNIRVVKPDATKAEVIKAAQAAELHGFIMTLPKGYQTNAGEAGGRLSGGQKQRIAIARAMLCNPAILVLDEATSALDAETAAAVDATIHELAKERTVISISHHLRTVTKANKIFVLDQGKIVEQGRHEQLLAQDGLYAQLWQTQTAHDQPEIARPNSQL